MSDKRKFRIGQLVHVDTDNKEWGRVASDGKVDSIHECGRVLVNVFSIRANIYVPKGDISPADSQKE